MSAAAEKTRKILTSQLIIAWVLCNYNRYERINMKILQAYIKILLTIFFEMKYTLIKDRPAVRSYMTESAIRKE